MQYTIVTARSAGELEQAVNRKIADGWRPQGGVAFQDNEEWADRYAQAMVMDGDQITLGVVLLPAQEKPS